MIKQLSILLLSCSTLTSCWFSTEWTEEERESFRIACEDSCEFLADRIVFEGFDFEEVDTVMVIERDSFAIDTFYVYSDIKRSEWDKKRNRFSISKQRILKIGNTYDFFLGTGKPYSLRNMKMTMEPEYTMGGEDWGCRMENFQIDDSLFQNCGNITFTRRP